jgi:hypothetical protein
MVANRSCRFAAALAALTMTIWGPSAFAANVGTPAKAMAMAAPIGDSWTFSLTPYAWATSLNGSTTVLGRTTDIDAGFFDILDHTEFPKNLFQLSALGEARYGKFGILTDIAYMKIGVDGNIAHSRGVDALNASVGVSGGLKVQMMIAEIAGAYEVAHWGALTSPTSGTALDVYGGGRVWWQKADADFAVTGTVNILGLTRSGGRNFSASGDVSWVDPVVGLRLRHEFMPGLDLNVSGDIGGFGAGSKFSWQALAVLNYEFAKQGSVSWNAMLGYKALYVDYEQGSGLTQYKYDMTMHGPIFGITARF